MRHAALAPSMPGTLLNFASMKLWIFIPALLAMPLAHGATINKPAPNSDVPVTSARTNAPTQLSNLGPVAQGAAQDGIRRCLPRIDQVVNFLSAGAQTGAMIFAPPVDADNRLTAVVLEVLGSNGLSYIDTSYAPNSNACDAMYQTVTYWTDSCDKVAQVAFPSFKKAGPIRQYIAVLDGGSSAKVFLMPAGAGCISVKKEVLF